MTTDCLETWLQIHAEPIIIHRPSKGRRLSRMPAPLACTYKTHFDVTYMDRSTKKTAVRSAAGLTTGTACLPQTRDCMLASQQASHQGLHACLCSLVPAALCSADNRTSWSVPPPLTCPLLRHHKSLHCSRLAGKCVCTKEAACKTGCVAGDRPPHKILGTRMGHPQQQLLQLRVAGMTRGCGGAQRGQQVLEAVGLGVLPRLCPGHAHGHHSNMCGNVCVCACASACVWTCLRCTCMRMKA